MMHHSGARWIIASLQIAAFVSLVSGLLNLRRESELLFLEEGTIFKIAHFLKLNRELNDQQQWIKGEVNLIQPKWLSSTLPSSNRFFARIKRLFPRFNTDPQIPRTPLAQWAQYHSWKQLWIPPCRMLWVFAIAVIVSAYMVIKFGAYLSTQNAKQEISQSVDKSRVAPEGGINFSTSEFDTLKKQLSEITSRLEAIEKTASTKIPQPSYGRPREDRKKGQSRR